VSDKSLKNVILGVRACGTRSLYRAVQGVEPGDGTVNHLFISYRRGDTKWATGRIYDRLIARFGKKRVFIDIEAIEGGVDYLERIQDAVRACDVCVAVIGEHWLTVRDASGTLRLSDPNDLLRIEIATALRHQVTVIPCLVDEARLPPAGELPDDLRSLATRQQVRVTYQTFDRDIITLIRATKEAFARANRQRREARLQRWKERYVTPVVAFAQRRAVLTSVLAAALAIGTAAGVYAIGSRPAFVFHALWQERPAQISNVWLPGRGPSHPSPADWRDEVLYYVLPNRFSDGAEGGRSLLDRANLQHPPDWDPWLRSGMERWQGGTLAGLQTKLGYLRDLGVSTIWLAPVVKQRAFRDVTEMYLGLAPQDFLDVDPHLGSRRDLVNVVSAAHKTGMRVILSDVCIPGCTGSRIQTR
jgi:hypothetical protein